MSTKVFNILFLATENSTRSILAEALTNSLPITRRRFLGYSAGSHPVGVLNVFTEELLRRGRFFVANLHSKSWDEFAKPEAPVMDFVITLCDRVAGEQCPAWPGQPMTVHWGMPDPAAVRGTDDEIRKAFSDTALLLTRRLDLLASLPIDKLDRVALQNRMRDIATN